VVFVTKYGRNVLPEAAHETLRALFINLCQDFEARLVNANGEDDHVQLLAAYPPKVAISTLVNSLKGMSSRRLR
jgi:putative transposase